MDYQKIYTTLVRKGQSRILEGYSEKHHIVPRCLGGTDEATNLVSLTPEEHYLCHLILVKIYPNGLQKSIELISINTLLILNKIF